MVPEPERDTSAADDVGRCRWGVFFYLCRNTPQYVAIAEQEWGAITSLSVAPSLSVAIQQDSHQGARRWFAAGGSAGKGESIGPRNLGCVHEAKSFLNWAATRAPSEHTVLVLAGTGILDPWSVVGGQGDPTRTFAICDDADANDALDVSELKTVFEGYQRTTGRSIDVLILDMSAMQWLEVAYQLKGLVKYVVGAQSPICPGVCPVSELLTKFASDTVGQPVAAEDLVRQVAAVLGTTYQARVDALPVLDRASCGPVAVSALNLAALEPVARAFDTFSHALMLALGEESVWQAREQVAKDARSLPFGRKSASPVGTTGFYEQYAYDLLGLMEHAAENFKKARLGAVSTALVTYLAKLDDRRLLERLKEIDDRANRAAMKAKKPRRVGPALAKFLAEWGAEIRAARMEPARMKEMCIPLGAVAASDARSENDGFWTDWASDSEDKPSERIRLEIEIAKQGRAQTGRLEELANRAIERFRSADKATKTPLVMCVFPAASPACGLALYRPGNLDKLLNANYLHLEFNRRSHWTALLAVINLVHGHSRAMWRVIESMLSTAALDAREALLQRVFGPTSVMAGFREQLSSIASPPIATFSISERGSTAREDAKASHYAVRYTPCEPLAVIAEERTSITAKELTKRVSTLGAVLSRKKLTAADLEAIDGFGRSLGEDVIKKLAARLGEDRDSTEDGAMHLQLQLPRELMRFPWELMQDREGRLSDRYALARQVYVPEGLARSRPRLRHNRLRPLIVAAPPSAGSASLAASEHEGTEVVKCFQVLHDELGDVIDFKESRDAWIGKPMTVQKMRQLLGRGDYDIVHFSGHGLFQENEPERSGLVLSDGLLDAEAIRSTLSWSKKPPWLVYANACQSAEEDAVYQGDLHGLASAFITNGVAAYIGTLWNVADLVGHLMAVSFYEFLCLERMTLGQALRAARKKVQVLPPTLKDIPAEIEVEALLALTSYSFALFGDPTAKALGQIGTESPETADAKNAGDPNER